jgi:hypothetical protein
MDWAHVVDVGAVIAQSVRQASGLRENRRRLLCIADIENGMVNGGMREPCAREFSSAL